MRSGSSASMDEAVPTFCCVDTIPCHGPLVWLHLASSQWGETLKFNYLPPLLLFAIACVLLIAQQNQQRQQPASKRFIKGNIPLEEIFAEWNTKGLKGPRYICLCTQTKCDTRPSWPQRSFAEGEAIPVLGDFNRNRKQQMGFTQCSPYWRTHLRWQSWWRSCVSWFRRITSLNPVDNTSHLYSSFNPYRLLHCLIAMFIPAFWYLIMSSSISEPASSIRLLEKLFSCTSVTGPSSG